MQVEPDDLVETEVEVEVEGAEKVGAEMALVALVPAEVEGMALQMEAAVGLAMARQEALAGLQEGIDAPVGTEVAEMALEVLALVVVEVTALVTRARLVEEEMVLG